MNELQPSPALLCANCSTELKGEFCHECGQSLKSVILPISHMLEDAGDLFFHLDERIVHTLPPLYAKPGFLTLEYFSGRRVRYIAPFRLMFVFGLLALFFVHLAVNRTHFGSGQGVQGVATDSVSGYAAATSADDVRTLYAAEMAKLREQANAPYLSSLNWNALGISADLMHEAANARLAQLQAPPLPADTLTRNGTLPRGGAPEAWAVSGSHVNVGWLPAIANDRLNAAVVRLKANFIEVEAGGERRKEAVARILEGFFGVLPQIMFVLIPIFALVLKLFYVFRRRLYMEHVIVALHSHAFIFISLIGVVVLGFAASAIRPHAGLVASGLNVVQVAMWLWIPVYLLIMQKRVYRQGWFVTVVKFWLIGGIYVWLLLFAFVIAAAIGLAH